MYGSKLSRGFCVKKSSRTISRVSMGLIYDISQAVSIVMFSQQPLAMENETEPGNSETILMQFKTIRTSTDGQTVQNKWLKIT
jgi:hypothetical protein